VHEQLSHPTGWPVRAVAVEIRHWGYADAAAAKQKGRRNLELLVSAPETARGDFYHLYQLGRTMFNLRYYKEAEEYLVRAVNTGIGRTGKEGLSFFSPAPCPAPASRVTPRLGQVSSEARSEVSSNNQTGIPGPSRGEYSGLSGREPESDPGDSDNPVNPALWSHAVILLSRIHLRLGRQTEAEEALRLLVNSRPDYGPAQAQLGRLLYDQGRLGDCIPHLQRALDLGCGDPGWGADHRRQGFIAACQLAKALRSSDQPRRARQAWEQASRLNPDNPEPLVAQAESLLAEGQTSLARGLIRKAVLLAPNHYRARLLEAAL
jgi:tetratricopeptide (TPR) repeat protein